MENKNNSSLVAEERGYVYKIFDQFSKFERDRENKFEEMGSKWRKIISTYDYKKSLFNETLNQCCKKGKDAMMLKCIEWVASMAYDCGLMDGYGDDFLEDHCNAYIGERLVGRKKNVTD